MHIYGVTFVPRSVLFWGQETVLAANHLLFFTHLAIKQTINLLLYHYHHHLLLYITNMKLTTLLCATIIGFSTSQQAQVAAATPQSLRGFQLETEALFANCDTTQTCNGKGQNSCETLQKNCNLCYWNYQSGKCVPTGQPTPRSNCQVNKDQCPSGQWCATSQYGQCATGSKGRCTYYTGYVGSCPSYGNKPVCGCDWNTYQNVCYAQAAGVNILRIGKC